MWWLSLILIALAFPVGLWIAWLARDELIAGRPWFRILIIAGVLGGLVFLILKTYAAASTSVFIAFLAGTAYWKSFDRQWTLKRRVLEA